MKITFLVNGAEPTKNGVGDYTRLLAEECVRTGNACSIIALSDRHVSESATSTIATKDGDMPLLRLPVDMGWEEKIWRVSEFNALFLPDCFSLQFVPYGYHPKGMVGQVGGYLKQIVEGRPLHIMFHELWIGEATLAPLKHRLVGILQRRGILKMLRTLKPGAVATSNPVYTTLLRHCGVNEELLPLFGNIAWVEPGDGNEIPGGLSEGGNAWMGLFFGAFHAEWKPEPLFGMLLRAAKQGGRQLHFVAAGTMGEEGENTWEEMRQKYGPEILFTKLGKLPAGQVSRLFQTADFGIATSPLQLIGKSSAAASMIDHGLPVIVSRDDWKLRGKGVDPVPLDPLLYPLDDAFEGKLAQGLPREGHRDSIKVIAGKFLASLNAMPGVRKS